MSPELLAQLALALPVGDVRAAVQAPNPVLSTRCAEVDPRDPATVALAADLLATMAAAPGCVGLAANQIGIGQRVFSLDVSEHPKTRTHHGRFVLVNPVIEQASPAMRRRGRVPIRSGLHWRREAATRLTVRAGCQAVELKSSSPRMHSRRGQSNTRSIISTASCFWIVLLVHTRFTRGRITSSTGDPTRLRDFVASVTAKAQVVEQADTLGLNPSDFGRTGSSPVLGTVCARCCQR